MLLRNLHMETSFALTGMPSIDALVETTQNWMTTRHYIYQNLYFGAMISFYIYDINYAH